MNTAPLRYGFLVVGDTTKRRRPVDAAAALAGYAACVTPAEVDREGYLSAFWFGDDFCRQLRETGSIRGFDGVCWAPFLWFDIDCPDDPAKALEGARRLVMTILRRYPILDEDAVLIFFSGSKGYHIGLPTFWRPAPTVTFHKTARNFAEMLATEARVNIDASIYDKLRCFRAPNSQHPKTGLHKRRLSLDELLHLSPEGIRGLAAEPVPFALPIVQVESDQATKDWNESVRLVEQEAEVKAQRRAAAANGSLELNRQTLDFIRNGADVGDRHRLLFSAAANLAEFGCSSALAHALLTEAGLDCGLPPKEVHRQIECGLNHVKGVLEGTTNA
jgi:hypothetical protein